MFGLYSIDVMNAARMTTFNVFIIMSGILIIY